MKFKHCCSGIQSALEEREIVHHLDENLCYSLVGGTILNFCPFCGKALPGALVTDWELHEKCERCHWTGARDDAKMPLCICSKSYRDLKQEDETY